MKTPRRRPSPRVQDERGADERGRRDTRVRVAVVLEPPLLFASVSSGERGGWRRDEPRGSHGEPVREPRRAPTLALADGSGGIRQVLSTAAGGFAAGGAGSLAVVCRVRLWLFCDGVGGERV